MSKFLNVKIPEISVLEDGSVVVAARMTDGTPAKTFLKQADVLAISYKVFNKKTGVEIVASTVLVVADVIFDTPKSWDCDALGYNFLNTFPPASFPDGKVVYTVEVRFELTGGHLGWIVFNAKTKSLFTS